MTKTPYTVPNQRSISIKKVTGKNKMNTEGKPEPRLYATIDLDASNYAAEKLSPASFMLWFYIDKNQNGYGFSLSRADFCSWCGLSKNTYLKAFKQLVEEGFLEQDKYNINKYTFYEMPKKPTEVKEKTALKKEENSPYDF